MLTACFARFAASENDYDWRSPEVENPTWLQVAVFANEMLCATRETERVYLEDVAWLDKFRGRTYVEFHIGK